MDRGRNRLVVALGTVAAIALLLGAFMVVWLMPREPGVGNAGVQGGPGVTSGGGSAGDVAPASKGALVQTGGVSAAPITEQPHVSVRGTGIVTAKPDIVNLQIGVQIQRDSLDAAQAEAATKMDAAMNQLKAAGIDEKDISTAQYSVEPVYDYRDNQPPRVLGFRVTNILNVKLRDIGKAGKTIDDLVKSGANTVYGLSFGFSDPTAVLNQAREQAMADARAKASQLATLGGVTLGAPLVIDDGGASVPPAPQAAGYAGAPEGRDAVAQTAINPGQQEIRVEVTVVYAIK